MRLLDISVLLALCDPNHVHHSAAHPWFERNSEQGWATCPLTENGFVRILSHPRYPGAPGTVTACIELLRQFCRHPTHQFWPDEISLLDACFHLQHIAGPAQITDVYLLGLAMRRNAKFVTLDQHISGRAVEKGKQHLEIISA